MSDPFPRHWLPLRILLRADGTQQIISHAVTMEEVQRLIGAESVDTVTMRHLGEPTHVMLVDDLGYEYEVIDHGGGHIEHRTTRALKPVNHAATHLYQLNCKPGTTHQIVGDVIVCPDEDFAA